MEEYEKTGTVTLEYLKKLGNVPPEERLRKGPVAMTECVQDIPCNPCSEVCPTKSIHMDNINDRPKIDFDTCIGCTLCMQVCPGLAIFMLDKSKEKPRLTIPYEMLPMPERGDIVKLLNREGEEIGEGKVVALLFPDKRYKSALVTVEVDDDMLLYEARNLRVVG
jgi:Fe-S-cluster-containing hydrogenase component 2